MAKGAWGLVRSKRWIAALGLGVVAIASGLGLAWAWPRWFPDSVQRGEAAYARGDWRAAAAWARARLKGSRDDPAARRLLARAVSRLGQEETAIALYGRLPPESLRAEDHYLLGASLSHRGQVEAARISWERALELDPDQPEALDALMRFYIRQVRPVAAARCAERLARQPGREVEASLLLGQLREEIHDPRGAVAALRRALALDPQAHAGTLTARQGRKLLAHALLQIERPGEAKAELRTVLAEGPDPEAEWLLSRACLQEGSLTEASDALGRSGSFRAENPLAFEPSPYIGSARCEECHAAIHHAEQSGRHSRTFSRVADLKTLPIPAWPVRDPADPTIVHSFKKAGDRIQVETSVEGKVFRALVEFAFGADDRYLSLVGRDDQGRDRILRLSYAVDGTSAQWDRTTGQPPRPEPKEEFLGKPLEQPDGLYRCLFCHTTNPRAVLDGDGPEATDRAIGCERCHGPGGLHLKAVEAKFTDLAIVNPALATAEAINKQLCGQCHALHERSANLNRNDPALIRFPSTTLPWSRCATASGTLSCVTCHEPHHNARTSTAAYESKCLDCHAPCGARAAACPVKPAQGCVACHMPATRIEILHGSFTDHDIRIHENRATPPEAVR
jgi:tetratricopeptide (TPR) repeat protein